MSVLQLLQRLWSKESEKPSKEQAKERLRLVLVHDRVGVAPDRLLPMLKDDLIAVISKYMEIDEAGLDVTFSQDDSQMALVASIPVRGVRQRA